MQKDDIFKKKINPISNFSFDKRVVQVFDDMVSRSIPMYKQTQNLTAEIVEKKYRFQGIIYDLGCSTGQSIYTIATKIRNPKLKIVGIDSSKFMVKKCQETLSSYVLQGDIKIVEDDILTMAFEDAEMIVMHYTLQFIVYSQKNFLLQNIYNALPKGGIFIFSEKLKQSDTYIEKWFTQIYYDFKREQGYSELEIAQKRESLENFLEPLSSQNLCQILQEIGFSTVTILCQFLNFGTFIAVK